MPTGLQWIDDGLLCSKDVATWISVGDANLQLQFCVNAHTEPSQHRLASTAAKVLHQHYTWTTIAEHFNTFVWAYVHCLSTIRGGKVPRPYARCSCHSFKWSSPVQLDQNDLSSFWQKIHSSAERWSFQLLLVRFLPRHTCYCSRNYWM